MQLISRSRRTFAYLLLIVFSLVALPKELWHHCEYPSIHIQDENSEQAYLSVTQELCTICAIQIAPFISPTNQDRNFDGLIFQLQVLSQYVGQEFKPSTSISLRGPPSGKLPSLFLPNNSWMLIVSICQGIL